MDEVYERLIRAARKILTGKPNSLKPEITEALLPQHWKDYLHTSPFCRTDAFIEHVNCDDHDVVVRLSVNVHFNLGLSPRNT